MKKAQLHLEAIIAFFFIASFLAAATAVFEKNTETAASANDSMLAEASAQECALIVNALAANTETALKKSSANCFAGENFEIKSVFGEKEKSAFCIAKEIKTIQIGGETFLEAKTSGHYKKNPQ